MATMTLGTLIQFRRPIWPNPEDSVGREFGQIPKTKLSYWEATGPAQAAYQKLLPEVLAVLAEKQGPIPNSDFVWFSLYMVGPSPSAAAPFIMFASEQRSQRRQAMNHIKNSKILVEYPGMQAGEWAEAPHIGRQEQKGSSRESIYRELQIPDSITADAWISTGFQVSAVLTFYYPDRTTEATASVMIDINNICYYLVPSHVLFPPRPAMTTKTEIPGESYGEGFDFGYFMEDDYLSEDDRVATSLGSISSSSSSSPSSQEQSLNYNSTEYAMEFQSDSSSTTAQPPLLPHFFNQGESNAHENEAGTNCPVVSIDLDYALCRVRDTGTKPPSICLPLMPPTLESLAEPDENGTRVQVLTIHGLLNGYLSRPRTHVCLPNSSSYQEVYVASFESPVLPGDCGAMVYTALGGKVLGHIITGSAESTKQTAFVIPVKHVQEDILRRLDMLNSIKNPYHRSELPNPKHSESSSTTAAAVFSRHNPAIDSTNSFGMNSPQYGKTLEGVHTPPFLPIITSGQLVCGGADAPETVVQIDIHGTIDKGFFRSNGEWMTHGRDYFSCLCAFSLTPPCSDLVMNYVPDGSSTSYLVRGFAMSISAVASDSGSIELVQHTSKEKSSQTPQKERLFPKSLTQPFNSLSMYESSYGQASQDLFPIEHEFERLQIKQAIVNYGKSWAAHYQHFHIILELYADVGRQSPEQWMKVAQRKSARLVARAIHFGSLPVEGLSSLYGLEIRDTMMSPAYQKVDLTSSESAGLIATDIASPPPSPL
ncbi:hypothetical protein GGS24DRAFT_353972 [Hypoxylon argillaceum]|nr:hypothetical protein GGS24DRAFT_353972 [Hypoxylon argillaceum]